MVVEVRQHPVQEQRREDEGQEALAVQPLQRSASTSGATVDPPRFVGGVRLAVARVVENIRQRCAADDVLVELAVERVVTPLRSLWNASGRLWRRSSRYRSVRDAFLLKANHQPMAASEAYGSGLRVERSQSVAQSSTVGMAAARISTLSRSWVAKAASASPAPASWM